MPLRHTDLVLRVVPDTTRFGVGAQHNLVLVQPQHFKNGDQLLPIKRVARQLQVRLRHRVNLLGVIHIAVRRHPQHHALALEAPGFIGQENLRPPAIEHLVELVVALVIPLVVASLRRVERQPCVFPVHAQHALEIVGFILFVNGVDIADHKTDVDNHRAIALRRAGQVIAGIRIEAEQAEHCQQREFDSAQHW